MLSAMTTSENFPLISQSRCSPSSTYHNTVYQPGYVATILRQNFQVMSKNGGNLLKYQLIQEPDIGAGGKIDSAFSYYLRNNGGESMGVGSEAAADKTGRDTSASPPPPPQQQQQPPLSPSPPLLSSPSSTETAAKSDFENDLTELLDQIEIDDSMYEQSRPLKIDPNVLKLDFSKITISGDVETLQRLCTADIADSKRASHHLSGGSLLTDASHEEFGLADDKSAEGHRFARYSAGGVMGDEAGLRAAGPGPHGPMCPGLLNPISPSTPLTFDLSSSSSSSSSEVLRGLGKGVNVVGSGAISGLPADSESTNPFRNYLVRDSDKEEETSSFSPTNPFSDLCGSSSPNGAGSCSPPRYENITLPQKSFSQCSTCPASPVLKSSADDLTPSVSNPFLINETSPESSSSSSSYPAPSPVSQFIIKGDGTAFQDSVAALHPNRNSFIFAVPIFSVFPQNITNSSTQTVDLTETCAKPRDPVYQNVTNQLHKFMRSNDHSEYDLQCLKGTVKDLRNSGWYYENVSWQESVILLKDTEPGTFLIRDSSDPNFLFSLSVQTSRGPTSVRLHYVNGHFRLDAEEKLIPHMPSFSSVIELIDYYVENTIKNKSGGRPAGKSAKKPGKQSIQKSKDQVWIDAQGNVYSNILLVKPLRKREQFSSLQHLARLTINTYVKRRSNAKVKFNFKVTPVYESSPFQDSSFQNTNYDSFCPILSTETLPIPPKLIEYLQDYPYCH